MLPSNSNYAVLDQKHRVREARRSLRAALDVDPDTGEDLAPHADDDTIEMPITMGGEHGG